MKNEKDVQKKRQCVKKQIERKKRNKRNKERKKERKTTVKKLERRLVKTRSRSITVRTSAY